MRPKPVAVLVVLLLVFATQVGCGSATRMEPISGILDAFTSHQVVALGEGLHGNTQSHAFRLSLIRDPRFATLVNDIVVEFGSARYQAVMDRFIAGGDVPAAELRKAWQDTTQNGLWDSPIYEEFFRAVREVNASLPRERQLRVLLGDPPIDWDTVRTNGDLVQWISQRDTHAGDLIDREVLSRNRRALVIYGDGHFRRVPRFAGSSLTDPTLVNLIEQRGGRVLAIWTNTTVELERLQRSIASWPIPSLTLVRGTKLGDLNFKYFAGMETDPPTKMEDQYDAVLYLGPPSSITMSETSAALCADAGYTKMRLARLALGPGGPAGEDVARFKKKCASERWKSSERSGGAPIEHHSGVVEHSVFELAIRGEAAGVLDVLDTIVRHGIAAAGGAGSTPPGFFVATVREEVLTDIYPSSVAHRPT